ncbi:hypothetical protein [Sphingomonas desiccabilis]|uniref:Uncharacterized protein n=1 Tax=Sphingomonas desiccabilis TaxID=429134 RepID=A0A4Q2IWL3_9SPHN|nr:hypothetical protein [Sphingomonas desiccabilis]MBB3910157.1 hypothetical protein [Sphingomonas desiccabilis]RXZ34836.1 hypothetical protein EO081_04030 [Sphingomonas desiccabilis]
MVDQDNDGWEDVTDAREVKALVGIKGLQQQTKSLPKAPPKGGAFDINTPETRPTGQSAQAAYTKVGAARAMLKQLSHVRSLYDKNMSAGGLAGVREFNPLNRQNQEFDGAVSAIPLLARQAFRVAGSGSDSDRELKLITDALPNRWSFDATNAERFKTLDSVLRGFITSYGGLAGYSPAQLKALSQEHTYGRPLPKAPVSRPNSDALRRKYGLK